MVGRKPARVLPAPVAATSSALRPAAARSSISSWCRRGCQPLASNHCWTTAGRALLLSLVGPLAPALFLFAVEIAGPGFGRVARLVGPPPHDQPQQHDQQDRRADDADDPELCLAHLAF